MKVVVLTTSYPAATHPVAGTFVRAYVDAARAAAVDVDVVSPDVFGNFGLAYGAGIPQNLRAAPWKAAALPPFLVAFAIAARRAARHADIVHAHWIPSALVARAAGKPYVLQVWGTDVELGRNVPTLVRPLFQGAGLTIAGSEFLADAARTLGARRVEVVPVPLRVPECVGEPEVPAHVLYVGRLSEEKGILEFLAATEGLPRVIVGDGPLRARVPEALGFVPPEALGAYYERAAVVCVPSRREGYGMTAREALTYGRPVVATRVGGLADLDGHAVLVPPRDVSALRVGIEGLLADDKARRAMGSSGRDVAIAEWSPPLVAAALTRIYREVVAANGNRES
jgi:glycosyltransferase involved in cell wall biosynthesis